MINLFAAAIGVLLMTPSVKTSLQATEYQSIDSLNQVIDLRESVLFEYYKQYVTKLDLTEQYSFEIFKEEYECSGISIYDFVNSSVTTYVNEMNLASSSDDADKYMLGTYNYEITPVSMFKKGVPTCFALSYIDLRPGDIIYEDKIENFNHMGIIVDPAHRFSNVVSLYETYVQTIESVNSSYGVQYGYLDDQRVLDHNVKILRYKPRILTTNEQENIIYFLGKQLGKPYSVHFGLQTDINSPNWYCTELVWAAYQYIGINLAPYLDDIDKVIIYGTEIYTGGKLYERTLEKDCFLSFTIVNKNNGWNLKLFNPNSYVVGAEYNSKMCFDDDAKNWNKLNDLVTVEINYHSFVNINIKENWFATTIVAGYTQLAYNMQERLITWANTLDANTKTLNEYTTYQII